jgi:hypothetical protein
MTKLNTREAKTAAMMRLKLRQEIARISDGYADAAQELATKMEKTRLKISQVRGLESVAYTTDKVSDILDLVKKQIGRERWRAEVGEDLLDELGKRQADARRIAQAVDRNDGDLPRRAHLLLCREYIKHLAAHFVYWRRLAGGEEEER